MPGDGSRIMPSPHEPGVYYVDRDTWQVGNRYELQKVLGTGSFSAVCLAWDRIEGEKVALKRVGDVFASPEYARRVLREVCIMRRLEHPNIVRLKDVFLRPSPTGKYVFRGGRLVPTSFDCYMAMEYCDQGDLFNMRGQLPEHEVRSLMWQLLSALRYLHGLSVWHRDIKTGNLLLTWAEGRRVLKVADFGCSRSAKESSEAGGAGEDARPLPGPGPGPPQHQLQGAEAAMEVELQDVDAATSDSRAATAIPANTSANVNGPPASTSNPPDPGGDGAGAAAVAAATHCPRPPRSKGLGAGLTAVPAPEGGYQPPLTSLVCTPCYRAPEVVMSRGSYSSAMDMWSAGCVFGELLQRAVYLGKAATPHLQVAPVFAISGKPLTPTTGQHYGASDQGVVGGASAYSELSALFAVIGTPAWACIEAVPSEAWRRYLFHIPGKAPTLHRRFGQAGEVAVDLLARLLQFDPGRRASAEEAMAHEYFAIMHMEAQMEATELTPAGTKALRHSALAARPGSPGRLRASSSRRSGSSVEPEDSAAAASKPHNAAAANNAPAVLPTWPPGRSTPQRCSASGAGTPREGPSDMEVTIGEAGAAAAVTAAGKEEGSAARGVLVTAAASVSPRLGNTAAGSSSTTLLTKRKLEDALDAGVAEQQQQQQAVQGAARVESGQGQGGGGPQQVEPAARLEGSPGAQRQLSFWQIDDPSMALAALEAELAALVPLVSPASSSHGALGHPAAGAGTGAATALQTPEALAFVEQCKERLRVMLERECEEHAARAAARRANGGAGGANERGARSSGGGDSGTAGSGTFPAARGFLLGGTFPRTNSDGMLVGPDGQLIGGGAGPAALHGHLRPDPGQQLDPSLIGYERIPYHADAATARLEPEKHLWAGRHGEWTESSLAAQRREQGTGTWGVTLLPPGMDEDTAKGRAYIKVMRSQHAR